MAERIRGTIQYVPEARTFKNTKYYSIKVNDVYYSVGSKQPPLPGALVEFEAEKNGKGYWDVTKSGLTVVKGEEPSQDVASGAVTAAKNSPMSKDDYWRRKEDKDVGKDARIEAQANRNTAIEFVKLLITPFQTAEGLDVIVKLPAGKAKRVEFVENLVEQYTAQFIANNNKKNEKKNDEVPAEAEVPVADSPVDSDNGVWDA